MIGKRLSELRKRRGLSISELAKMSRLTPSFISQVEAGKVNLSMLSLRQICNVLKIPMFEMFLEDRDGDLIVRREKRAELRFPDSRVTYSLLVPNTNCAVQVMELKLDAGESSAPKQISHAGEEAALVMRGRIKVELGTKAYELRTSDSIYFKSRIPHRYRNLKRRRALVLISMTNPFIETLDLPRPRLPSLSRARAVQETNTRHSRARSSTNEEIANVISLRLRNGRDDDLKLWLLSFPPGERSYLIRHMLRGYLSKQQPRTE